MKKFLKFICCFILSLSFVFSTVATPKIGAPSELPQTSDGALYSDLILSFLYDAILDAV